ncbi:AfsR/SARP family transcriptional regulator [Amycolatopsis jiangsuensis]|uniref:DNA-binding SARP family transcriptional activator n=1 Tax=Amycolatopsis jiangsuensis TaxID=1181879 RepID=A0A840J392_9PSEU|nr:AfsR/SARP family transcriptional regulator [Amycolatopsis jiangsuensis]MBB4688343.1 DNA-binding SARP family transcriptional activator [Amycolatopsis jiangsuensis]
MRMAVSLLGPVRVRDGETEIDLGPAGRRSLFALLALRTGTTVRLDELIDGLWGETAPKTAEGIVYTYVSALRKALEPRRARGSAPRVLTGTRAGYALRLPADAIDACRFEAAEGQARRRSAAGDFVGARAQCDAALREWSGPPLAGATGPFAEAERSRLALLKLDVEELRCAALLETGGAGHAATALSALTAENPLHERLHELLMLALSRTGRQAEALRVYQGIRGQLVDELGIEPGPALRRMHERVLTGESAAPATTPGPIRVVPAQLPHGIAEFVGREDEARRLRELCESTSAGASGGSVVISAIDGCAGVGKTALAVHVAHEVAESFPDGQLFLDLRGFDPRHSPITPEAALAQLLRSLGADAEVISGDVGAQAALYRSLLAGRRMLVVLDNAVSAEQVRPLLPGSTGCLALVTSRNRLAGLVARNGAGRLSLDVLRPAESLRLLRGVLGAARVDAEPELAEELAIHCGHLPLALRIAAERILGGEHCELADLVAQLRVVPERLDALSTADDEFSVVRTVFSWSYHTLKPEEAHAFRLLGLHPAVELGAADAAALLGLPVPAARRQLEGLVRRHLLEQLARDRYRFHDLLRIYAAECAERDESAETRGEAVRRLVAWYLRATVVARELLAPGLGPIDPGPPDPDRPAPRLLDYHEAITWAGRELPALADVLELAAAYGLDEQAARLATALGALCHCMSRWAEWERVLATGLPVARRIGDRLAEGRLCNDFGVLCHFLGRAEESVTWHRGAVDLLGKLDRRDEAVAVNLAVAYLMIGWELDALPLLEDALAIAREQHSRFVEASVADGLGSVLSRLGRHDEAIELGLRCVELLQDTGAEHMLAHGLREVGQSCLRAGQVEEAVRHLGDAVDRWHELGDRWGEISGSHALARALYRSGRTEPARRLLTDALETIRESGYLGVQEREEGEMRALLTEIG